MEALIIEATESHHEIILDKANNIFKIEKRSFPEDATDFYTVVINWMEQYIHDPNEITEFAFKLEYYNTATSKQFYKILILLEQLAEKKTVIVKWYYKKEDLDMLASGDIYTKLTKLDILLVEF